MRKKEYYTFADLIIKLRDYYQEVQRILKEMEKCILIQTPHKVKYAISFSMTDSKFSEYEKDYRNAKGKRDNGKAQARGCCIHGRRDEPREEDYRFHRRRYYLEQVP